MRKTKNGRGNKKVRAINPMKRKGEKRPGRTSEVDGRTRRKAIRLARKLKNVSAAARETGLTYHQVRYALARAA